MPYVVAANVTGEPQQVQELNGQRVFYDVAEAEAFKRELRYQGYDRVDVISVQEGGAEYPTGRVTAPPEKPDVNAPKRAPPPANITPEQRQQLANLNRAVQDGKLNPSQRATLQEQIIKRTENERALAERRLAQAAYEKASRGRTAEEIVKAAREAPPAYQTPQNLRQAAQIAATRKMAIPTQKTQLNPQGLPLRDVGNLNLRFKQEPQGFNPVAMYGQIDKTPSELGFIFAGGRTVQKLKYNPKAGSFSEKAIYGMERFAAGTVSAAKDTYSIVDVGLGTKFAGQKFKQYFSPALVEKERKLGQFSKAQYAKPPLGTMVGFGAGATSAGISIIRTAGENPLGTAAFVYGAGKLKAGATLIRPVLGKFVEPAIFSGFVGGAVVTAPEGQKLRVGAETAGGFLLLGGVTKALYELPRSKLAKPVYESYGIKQPKRNFQVTRLKQAEVISTDDVVRTFPTEIPLPEKITQSILNVRAQTFSKIERRLNVPKLSKNVNVAFKFEDVSKQATFTNPAGSEFQQLNVNIVKGYAKIPSPLLKGKSAEKPFRIIQETSRSQDVRLINQQLYGFEFSDPISKTYSFPSYYSAASDMPLGVFRTSKLFAVPARIPPRPKIEKIRIEPVVPQARRMFFSATDEDVAGFAYSRRGKLKKIITVETSDIQKLALERFRETQKSAPQQIKSEGQQRQETVLLANQKLSSKRQYPALSAVEIQPENIFFPLRPIQAQRPIQQLRPVQALRPIQAQRPIQQLRPVQALRPIQAQRPIQQLRPVQALRPIQTQRPIQQLRPVQALRPIQAQRPIQQLRPVQALRPVQKFTQIPAENLVPNIFTGFFSMDRQQKIRIPQPTKIRKLKQPRGYTPTLFSAVFKIKGKRTAAGEFTGLGIRPIGE